MGKKLTTEEFIKRSGHIHNYIYLYHKTVYVVGRKKVVIVCQKHGSFKQTPGHHLRGHGCPKCGNVNTAKKRAKSTEKFIEEAICKHGWKYNYAKVEYRGAHIKVLIFCLCCGKYFKQRPNSHNTKGYGCKECGFLKRSGKNSPRWTGGTKKLNLPLYNTYAEQLKLYNDVFKITKNVYNKNLVLLGVNCVYCGKIFIPTRHSVIGRLKVINGSHSGSSNFYCSENCKEACPTFNKSKYPKGFKPATSREVQPQLRKMVLKRDDYKCQICDYTEQQLHCHHITGVELNPIESADVDNCITLCKTCHKKVHKLPDCSYHELRRKQCKEQL